MSEGNDGGRDDMIRRRAHEIWESEGRPDNRSEQHWNMARAEFGTADRTTKPGQPQDEAGPSDTKKSPTAKSAAKKSSATNPRPAKKQPSANAAPQADQPVKTPGKRPARRGTQN